ncbi:MAG: hypothetical protein PVF47_00625 [Anaerolineae bacterium]|jgi:hypothetical protein
MKKKQVVALFGDSLLIDTVEASLRNKEELGIVRIQNSTNDVTERLKALSPDLIILDSNDSSNQSLFSFFKEQASIPLLCLDVSCNTVVALSCQHYTARTSNDLTHVIQMQTTQPPIAAGLSNC